MKEKLSVRKVYRNAYRYVLSHLFAFAFLTIFYFTGSLLPMLLGAPSFKLISLIYMYVFFYFATGCYYRQQLLWDKQLFIDASMRFLTAIFIFLFSIFVASLAINFCISFVKDIFGDVGFAITKALLNGPWWLVAKYICIFALFITFFVVPSFTFVSVITGKTHSLLSAYSKTRGSLTHIAITAFLAFSVLLLIMFLLTFVNVYVAAVARAALLAFISIVYFKVYDFFYIYPYSKNAQALKRDPSGRFLPSNNPNEGNVNSDAVDTQNNSSQQLNDESIDAQMNVVPDTKHTDTLKKKFNRTVKYSAKKLYSAKKNTAQSQKNKE